jgi:hypothetical protein
LRVLFELGVLLSLAVVCPLAVVIGVIVGGRHDLSAGDLTELSTLLVVLCLLTFWFFGAGRGFAFMATGMLLSEYVVFRPLWRRDY